MVAPLHSESCKISFMKDENQLGCMLMDLRCDLLDDLIDDSYWCIVGFLNSSAVTMVWILALP